MRRPVSTYRLQLTPTFGFRQAALVVPYLHELGITDVYLSPPFSAAPGSTHGYDVVDHNTLREELGGAGGFDELCAAIARHGMGQLLDFVPNHMGVGPFNPWWMDVLENGPSSVYAPYFDIDWFPVKQELATKVLVPVLGDQFGEVLERGELTLMREAGTFLLAYWEHRFPIATRQVPRLLAHRIDELERRLGTDDIQLQELQSIITALDKLAPRHEVDASNVAERAREKEVAKRRLAALFEASPTIRDFVDENVRLFNGTPGDPRSFDRLDTLLDHQAFRLAHWRVAGEEINYRRFFDINTLAAIRVEDPRVFEGSHRLVFQLVDEGKVTGLRIDHPDGLYAPSAYFERLQQERPGLYVVVEKVLEEHERMPSSWKVDGSTGYDFLVSANNLFVDTRNAHAFDELYARFTGTRIDWNALIYDKKRALMRSSMASEVAMLAHRLNRLSEGDRRTRDFTMNALWQALVEYIARLPIYRTYVEGETPGAVEERDRQYIQTTITKAKRASRDLNRSIFDFLRSLLLLEKPTPESVEFVRKLQQVSGPVTAKAIEDTAFYVYSRLVALNEVGGDPQVFGAPPSAFHALNQTRLVDWPGSLNATTTHDTKRAEDHRLRVCALSEIPSEWEMHIHRWAQLNQPHRTIVDGVPAPSADEELLFYQTLVGVFPDEGRIDDALLERVHAYLEKALKEGKTHSSWTNPDEPYEAAVKAFATGSLRSRAFLEDFAPFARRVATAARLSSLAQVALKVASPGVPDIYQGCELEDLSLVDPDNRRPVDFALRARLLAQLGERLAAGPAERRALAHELSAPASLADGRAKLLLLRESLRLRREEAALFLRGSYEPLVIEGRHAAHVVAFARRYENRSIVCVVPRLCLQLLDEGGGSAIRWDGQLSLPAGLSPSTNLVSGERVQPQRDALSLADCFQGFPVALLR